MLSLLTTESCASKSKCILFCATIPVSFQWYIYMPRCVVTMLWQMPSISPMRYTSSYFFPFLKCTLSNRVALNILFQTQQWEKPLSASHSNGLSNILFSGMKTCSSGRPLRDIRVYLYRFVRSVAASVVVVCLEPIRHRYPRRWCIRLLCGRCHSYVRRRVRHWICETHVCAHRLMPIRQLYARCCPVFRRQQAVAQSR